MRSRSYYDYWHVSDPSNRVLIVAPSEYDASVSVRPLPRQLDEVSEALKAFFEPVPMLGRVTERMLADELRKGAGGIWFAGHAVGGAAGGLVLSDGLLPAVRFGRHLGRAQGAPGVIWSYLNTCDSGSFVAELQAVYPHDVFANIVAEVADDEASHNGVQFAQSIADSGSLISAYRWVVRGGPSMLRMFPNPDGDSVIRERGRDVIRANSEDRLRRLEQTVNGDQELGLLGLAGQYRQINSDLRIIKWSLGIAVAGMLLFVAFQFWTPEPRVIIQVATPTPFFAPNEPGGHP